MIGLDFPVKPAWIHDVLRLWQPNQPVGGLVNAALAQTVSELGGEKARRNSLTVILRYFVPTVGGGQTRRTTDENVWAAYAATFSSEALAPAYLARIIAGNDVARAAAGALARRAGQASFDLAQDKPFDSQELRRRIIAQFGERKVVVNSANAFLRTLVHFGVLAAGDKLGQYRFLAPLPVTQQVFPLLVWAWWEAQGGPQIDTDAFAAEPAVAFVQTEDFPAHWRACSGRLWSLEERLESRRVTLRHTDRNAFERATTEALTG